MNDIELKAQKHYIKEFNDMVSDLGSDKVLNDLLSELRPEQLEYLLNELTNK